MRASPQRLLILAVLVLTASGAAAPAAADPIQLVSGTISYSRLNLGQLAGNAPTGENVNTQFGNLLLDSRNPDHACFDCAPGSMISLSQSESFTTSPDASSNAADGSVRLGGIDYWLQSMEFHIDAGSPIFPNPSTGAITLTSPFSFRGTIVGRSLAGETQTFNFFGGGTATSTFLDNDWFATTYRFEAAAPTPEPGTLLLLGGPAAFALLRRRRQPLRGAETARNGAASRQDRPERVRARASTDSYHLPRI